MQTPLIEVCADGVRAAELAQEAGADRIELCSALTEGGVTPGIGLIEEARALLSIPLVVLVRPRRGDFLYAPSEFRAMLRDVRRARESGADGIASGVLCEDGSIDLERTAQLCEEARPMSFTFHRAFDHTSDPEQALARLRSLGVERILTSGAAASALEGGELLARLVREAGEAIGIIAAGGIRADHVSELVHRTGVREIHASARIERHSSMRHTNKAVPLDAATTLPDHLRLEPDPEEIARLRHAFEESN